MTTWAYLLIFNDRLGTRDQVKDFLNEIPEVTYWYACMPHNIFLTSTWTAQGISDAIIKKFGTANGQRFFITEIPSDRQGWMPNKVWHLIKNPESPRLD